MTIASEITRLQTAKANIKTSIENKGVTVPSSTTLDGYSTLIDSIVQGSTPVLQTKSKSYTPTESAQSETVSADAGYDGLQQVNVSVGAISSTYVGSGIPTRSSSDLTSSTLTVTAPSGYYSSSASKTLTSSNLTAGNIKDNVQIFGVTGTYKGKRVATGTFTVSSNINSGYVTIVTVANLGFDPKYIVIYNPSFSATANHVMYASCVPYNTTSYYKHTFKKASSNYMYTSSSGNRNPSSAGEVGVRNSEIQFYAGSSYIMGAGTWQYFAVEAIV